MLHIQWFLPKPKPELDPEPQPKPKPKPNSRETYLSAIHSLFTWTKCYTVGTNYRGCLPLWQTNRTQNIRKLTLYA